MSRGLGFIGSEEMQTSVANQEIIPNAPSDWTINYNLYKFSFYNEQPTKVKINNKHTIFLNAGQGFNSNESDTPIFSFVVIEPNVDFNWIGAY